MPIPQDPDWHPVKAYATGKRPSYDADMRRQSEESIRTQDCDGPLLDAPMIDSSAEPRQYINDEYPKENVCTDRAELIERIKRGESPTWVPNQAVSGTRILREARFAKEFPNGTESMYHD